MVPGLNFHDCTGVISRHDLSLRGIAKMLHTLENHILAVVGPAVLWAFRFCCLAVKSHTAYRQRVSQYGIAVSLG